MVLMGIYVICLSFSPQRPIIFRVVVGEIRGVVGEIRGVVGEIGLL